MSSTAAEDNTNNNNTTEPTTTATEATTAEQQENNNSTTNNAATESADKQLDDRTHTHDNPHQAPTALTASTSGAHNIHPSNSAVVSAHTHTNVKPHIPDFIQKYAEDEDIFFYSNYSCCMVREVIVFNRREKTVAYLKKSLVFPDCCACCNTSTEGMVKECLDMMKNTFVSEKPADETLFSNSCCCSCCACCCCNVFGVVRSTRLHDFDVQHHTRGKYVYLRINRLSIEEANKLHLAKQGQELNGDKYYLQVQLGPVFSNVNQAKDYINKEWEAFLAYIFHGGLGVHICRNLNAMA